MKNGLLGFLLGVGIVGGAGFALRPAPAPLPTVVPQAPAPPVVLRAPRPPRAAPCPTWTNAEPEALEQAITLTDQRTRLLQGQLELEVGTDLEAAPPDSAEAVRAFLNDVVPEGTTYQLDCTTHPCIAAIRFPMPEGGGMLDGMSAHLTGPIQASYPGSTFLDGIEVVDGEASVRLLATIHTNPAASPSQERRLEYRFEAFGR